MASKKILVVEDENIIALEIMSRLESLGFEVVDVVSNGEVAILKALESYPDLILMDIQLKGNCDGIEAAKRIKEKRDIPIIYLSAYPDDNIILKAKEVSDSFVYLSKPFTENELQASIKQALEE